MLARTGRQPWLDLLGDLRIVILPVIFILFWIVVPAMAIIRFYQWMRDALPEAGADVAARTKDGGTALQVEGGRVIEVGGVRA